MDIDSIRKAASLESGRRFLESYGEPVVDAVAVLCEQKMAQADDPGLARLAAWAADGDPIRMYEELGGTFDSQPIG